MQGCERIHAMQASTRNKEINEAGVLMMYCLHAGAHELLWQWCKHHASKLAKCASKSPDSDYAVPCCMSEPLYGHG